MFIATLIVLFFVVKCGANHTLMMKKLKAEAHTQMGNCSATVTKEWNDAVEKRYEISKKALKFEQDECLLAPLIQYDAFGPSGAGSSPKVTEPLRKLLRSLFRDKSKDIKTFFDAPCGDWVWMQYVDLGNVTYLGGDITSYTIRENERCFAKPNVGFTLYDLTCNKIPDVDLMLTRDVLFHLHPDVVMKILKSISQSKVRYFLSTTYVGLNEKNPFNNKRSYNEIKRGNDSTIGFRHINLFDAPFCMPKPLLKVEESGETAPRFVALWQLPFKVGDCAAVKEKGRVNWADY